MKPENYEDVLEDVISLITDARRQASRSINALLTATYWLIGKRIVEFEQKGNKRARYGEALLQRLSIDLQREYRRGFSKRNLEQMRAFYLWQQKAQTLSAQSQISPNPIDIIDHFPLPWPHYVRLLSIESVSARTFYEGEALRGGWTVRQLDRQISTQFYERTLLSRKKPSMLERGKKPKPEHEIKDPYVLEFLGLKNEYSESDLEAALIDLKLGKFTHADAGQMHMYLNYAKENWMLPSENPPVGIILCAQKNDAVVHYALDGLPNKVLAAEYLTTLPNENALAEELKKAQIQMKKCKTHPVK